MAVDIGVALEASARSEGVSNREGAMSTRDIEMETWLDFMCELPATVIRDVKRMLRFRNRELAGPDVDPFTGLIVGFFEMFH